MSTLVVGQGSKPALLEAPEVSDVPGTPLIVQVAKAHGVSPLRQMRESLALRFGANKLRPSDYYAFGLYDRAITMAEKRAYVGKTGNAALNGRLSPPGLIPTSAFVGNKVLYTALLAQLGLATTGTQAVVSKTRNFGSLQVLRDANAFADFLWERALFPLFGKPLHGSLSAGSVRIEALRDGHLHLGNGRALGVEAFCAEVVAKYPGGFVLQDALDPHPQMAAVTGGTIGCVRVVSVNDTGAPRPLYALWKIPAPEAMSDNFWQAGSMLANLDLANGTVKACRRGTGLETEKVETHPVSGLAIKGMTIPCWNAAMELAADAHAVFPEFGVCGWDIAVTPTGPRIIECNDNPFHTLYQLAARRGIYNPEFAPVWQAVADRQQAQLIRLKSRGKSRAT